MSNVNIDWSALGFEYQPIAKRYVANYKDGKWGKGELTDNPNVVLNECAGILQYCQQVFEGLKAYKTKDGRTVTFRPDQNAKRLMDSAKRLEMPPVPEDMFMEAVDEVVRANKDYIPPFEKGPNHLCCNSISIFRRKINRSSASNRLTNISSASSARLSALTSRTASNRLRSAFLTSTVQHRAAQAISKPA